MISELGRNTKKDLVDRVLERIAVPLRFGYQPEPEKTVRDTGPEEEKEWMRRVC